MASREDVGRWREYALGHRTTDHAPMPEAIDNMADMLERAAAIIEGCAPGKAICGAMREAWIREWRGEVDDER